MVLSGQAIKYYCLEKNMISPFREKYHNHGLSGGLSIAGYDVALDQLVSLKPGEFALASTLEQFKMPNNIIANVTDKSTWARLGITVQNTIIEPGWSGYLTLEIINHSKSGLIIKEGTPIAQIIFMFLDQPAVVTYDGKYQNQPRGPQQSIFTFQK